ncbi:transcription termination/antitermination protein NusA [Candidatus Falkowbacteria bacterium]|jgi:transcription termination/antitermination protein NusA|nr:transcription termination/antitermination protein NusA [Candidatus Falkowbacteria bacterium]MBT4433256.1 transcription termination/antitermination protein NusA [Candidatus Falkowbacteria bacterium]
MLDQKQFSLALKQICEEKGISEKQVLETIESALAAAYRKDYGNKLQNIKVEFSPEDGSTKIYDIKTVVEDMPEEEEIEESQDQKEDKQGKDNKAKEKTKKDETSSAEAMADEEEIRKFNPKTEIQLTDAKEIKKKYKIGDEIITKLEKPEGYGRMAAQTAKQVIIQKLREAERHTLYEEMKDQAGKVINGVIERYDRRFVSISIGRATAFLPPEEQIRGEMYNVGAQMKFYIVSVEENAKGPRIIVSRRNEEILKELFYLEIPEISSGVVEIKAIAREAGERSKVAVSTDDSSIDPIGSCIGQRGNRIQTIINELNGEKIDIIEHSDDVERFIQNSLSPAKITSAKINEKENQAIVQVKSDQFSLAIGKGGQNVRLATKLTNWKIDIEEITEKGKKEENNKIEKQDDDEKEEEGKEKKPKEEKKEKKDGKKPKDKKDDKKKDGDKKEKKAEKKKDKVKKDKK